MNGGYLMLDFKNTEITTNPMKIPGIVNADIIRANKPIVVCNLKSAPNILINMPTFAFSNVSAGGTITLSIATTVNKTIEISVDINDNITSPGYSTNTMSLESEVNPNAGNTDK